MHKNIKFSLIHYNNNSLVINVHEMTALLSKFVYCNFIEE